MGKDIQGYLRWLNMMINDEDERKEMLIEKFPSGGAKVLNSDGEVMLEATLEGDTWKVNADAGIYAEDYPLGTSGAWSPEQVGAFRLVEQVLGQL